MNLLHRWYCQSSAWKTRLETEILPWSLDGIELGDDVLELGPGPGLTTDWLRHRCRALTCIEVDAASAHSLSRRMENTNVRVQNCDASALPFQDCRFSAVVAFTMLHHVPSRAQQDELFGETLRVLKPGGVFAGTDSVSSLMMRIAHLGDTMNLVDPMTLSGRLERVGFADVVVEANASRFRFAARRPSQAATS